MRRLTLTLTLLGVLAISALAVIGTASAHDNCVHTDKDGWQLTGCVDPDGAVTWTAVDPDDNFYLWADGEWQEQVPPSLPELVYVPTITDDMPAVLGLPGIGKRDSGRILFSHTVDNDERSALTTLIVAGTTDNARFSEGWMTFSCKVPGGPALVSVDARAPLSGSTYPAWLRGPVTASFDSRSHRWHDVGFYVRNAQATRNLPDYVSYRHPDYPGEVEKMEQFFLELMRHDQFAVRLSTVAGPIVVTFDLNDVFDTPVQHLLELCAGIPDSP